MCMGREKSKGEKVDTPGTCQKTNGMHLNHFRLQDSSPDMLQTTSSLDSGAALCLFIDKSKLSLKFCSRSIHICKNQDPVPSIRLVAGVSRVRILG
ncbi:hypothetical protein TNCV_4882041 [Trichonephila clavipes]|nr:hypothetical protein TNCV_4882041 [Trichonephila clavipes]